MTKITKILAAAVGASLLIQPAIAQAGRQPVSVEFRYHDWQSAEENYKRLERVVRRACDTPGSKLMVTRIAEQACMEGMTDLAVSRLGKAGLAGVHYAETGRGGATSFAAR